MGSYCSGTICFLTISFKKKISGEALWDNKNVLLIIRLSAWISNPLTMLALNELGGPKHPWLQAEWWLSSSLPCHLLLGMARWITLPSLGGLSVWCLFIISKNTWIAASFTGRSLSLLYTVLSSTRPGCDQQETLIVFNISLFSGIKYSMFSLFRRKRHTPVLEWATSPRNPGSFSRERIWLLDRFNAVWVLLSLASLSEHSWNCILQLLT